MVSGGAHNLVFAGSNPALSTSCPIAQLEERRSYKADVDGSSPSRATIHYGCSSVDESATLRGSRSEVQVLSAVPIVNRCSFNGRTRDFDSRDRGSSPRRRATQASRPKVGLRIPIPPMNVRIVPGLPLFLMLWPNGQARDCKSRLSRFDSGQHLHQLPSNSVW